jgi:membrane protein DedA with SNARE-associated domain
VLTAAATFALLSLCAVAVLWSVEWTYHYLLGHVGSYTQQEAQDLRTGWGVAVTAVAVLAGWLFRSGERQDESEDQR